jgi:hypothetical protein
MSGIIVILLVLGWVVIASQEAGPKKEPKNEIHLYRNKFSSYAAWRRATRLVNEQYLRDIAEYNGLSPAERTARSANRTFFERWTGLRGPSESFWKLVWEWLRK